MNNVEDVNLYNLYRPTFISLVPSVKRDLIGGNQIRLHPGAPNCNLGSSVLRPQPIGAGTINCGGISVSRAVYAFCVYLVTLHYGNIINMFFFYV